MMATYNEDVASADVYVAERYEMNVRSVVTYDEADSTYKSAKQVQSVEVQLREVQNQVYL